MRGHLGALVVLVLSIIPAAAGQDMPRVATYAIDLSYVAEEPGIEARADLRFAEGAAVPQELTFYLHGELRVSEVRLDGESVDFVQDLVWYPADYSGIARRCRIDMTGRQLPKGLSIRYAGKLNPSVVQAPSNYMRVDSDGIFLRSFLYSVWFPVVLTPEQDTHPVEAEITVRTPPRLMAVVTGDRLGDTVDGEVRVSRWRSVGDIFDLQLTARPFQLIEEGGFHLYSLRDADSLATAREILAFTSELEGFFRTNYADRSGTGQLHVAQMPRFGDISSGNMVGISDRVWRGFDPSSYSGRTLAHELVHPFVQLPVSRQSAIYALVIEGFPSFFHLPAMAAFLGGDFYRDHLAGVEAGYLKRRDSGLDRRGNPLPTERPLLELTADDIPVYKDRFVLNDRAVLFCNWLRSRMGVAEFSRFTRELFALDSLDYETLRSQIAAFLPNSSDDVALWLRTTDFPDRFRLAQLEN